MRYTELREHYPVRTPHGRGLAIAVIDYGPQSDLVWVVVLADPPGDPGQVWSVPNPDVRFASNWTMGRGRAKSKRTPTARRRR